MSMPSPDLYDSALSMSPASDEQDGWHSPAKGSNGQPSFGLTPPVGRLQVSESSFPQVKFNIMIFQACNNVSTVSFFGTDA